MFQDDNERIGRHKHQAVLFARAKCPVWLGISLCGHHYITSKTQGNGYPLQYSCLENPLDRGVWQATVQGVTRVGQDLATKPPPPVFLPGEFHGQRRLVGYSPQGCKESDTTERLTPSLSLSPCGHHYITSKILINFPKILMLFL